MKNKLDTLKKLVYDIMFEDERARRDEPYLIAEVIKRKAPQGVLEGLEESIRN